MTTKKKTGLGELQRRIKGREKLHELGRQVIAAERLFGEGSTQHQKAVAAWQRQQKKLGVQ